MNLTSLAVALVALLASVVSGEMIKGHIKTTDTYAFLAKFCFVHTGFANMKIDAKGMKGVMVNVFLDEDWPKVYEKNLPCDQFVRIAQQSIQLDEKGDDFRFNFKQTQRPHYWYLTVSHCHDEDASRVLDVNYSVSFVNSGGRWDQQFSFDEQGLFGITLCFLLAFLCLLGVHFRGLAVWWEAEKYVHPILKMLTASMCLEAASLFLEFTHYCAFAYNGVGYPSFNSLSKFLDVLSQLLLIMLVILLAKGWTISKVELEQASFIIAVLGGMSVSYLLLFLYDLYFRNPASTVYIYDSFPGYLILLIRMGTFAWFLQLLRTTIEFEFDQMKRDFFQQFRWAFSVWFIYLPCVVIISVFLDAWVRRKTVEALYQLMNFLAFAAMSYLLWPTKASKYFKITGPDLMASSAGDGL